MCPCHVGAPCRMASRRLSLLSMALAISGCAAGTMPNSSPYGGTGSFGLSGRDAGLRDGRLPSPAAAIEAAPESLHGVWRGTYAGRRYQRRGRLTLVLVAATDSAVGTMTLDGIAPRAGIWGDDDRRGAGSGSADVSVTAVSLVGTRIMLRSLPYFDQACGCTLTLAFDGQLRGDTLTGRFSADGSPTFVPERGARWHIVRVRPPP